MDEVVIGTIAALAGTIIVGLYLAYHFFKIINGKDDSE